MKKTVLMKVYTIIGLGMFVVALTGYQTAQADKTSVHLNRFPEKQVIQMRNQKENNNKQSKPKVRTNKTIKPYKTVVDLPILPSQSKLILQRKLQWAIHQEQWATITPISRTLEITAIQAKAVSAPNGQKVVDEFGQSTSLKTIGEEKLDGDTWYRVLDHSKETWLSDEQARLLPTPSVLLNAPLVKQLPELPRGCEVTSLTMLLDQAGKQVNKMTLAKQIQKVPFVSNGFKGNPYDGFVGDLYSFEDGGLGVYHGPIAALARKYLGSREVDLTGKGWDVIEQQLDHGHAVWVITNATYSPLPESSFETWQTKEGPLKVTYKEHSVLVTGYGPHSVYINDPLEGIKNLQLDKTRFIQAWEQMGNQAVSYN